MEILGPLKVSKMLIHCPVRERTRKSEWSGITKSLIQREGIEAGHEDNGGGS